MGYLFFLLLRVFFEATFVVLLSTSTLSTFFLYRLALKPVRVDRIFFKTFLYPILKKNNIECEKLNIFLFWDTHKKSLTLSLKNVIHPQVAIQDVQLDFDCDALLRAKLVLKDVQANNVKLTLIPKVNCASESPPPFQTICKEFLNVASVAINNLDVHVTHQDQALVYKGLQLHFLHTLDQGCLNITSPKTHQIKAKFLYALKAKQFDFSADLESLAFPLKVVLPEAEPLILTGQIKGSHFFSSPLEKAKNKLGVMLKQKKPTVLKDGKKESVLKEMCVEGFIDDNCYWIQDYSFLFDKAFFHFSGQMIQVEDCLWKGVFQVRSNSVTIPLSVLGALWPPYAGENVREWIFTHFKGGGLNRIFTFMSFHCKPEMIVDQLFSAFHLEHSDLWINDKVPVIQDISAKAHADLKAFKIQILEGSVWDQKITSGTVEISPLNDASFLTANTHLEGELSSVLSGLKMFNLEELELLKLHRISGKNQIHLWMHFPLLDDLTFEQIDHKITANIQDGAFDSAFLKGRVNKAELRVELDPQKLKILGKSSFEQQPAEWNFYQNKQNPPETHLFFKGKVTRGFLENHCHIDLTPYIPSSLKCHVQFYPARHLIDTQLFFDAHQLNIPWIGLQKMPAVTLKLSTKLSEVGQKSVFQAQFSKGIKGSALLHVNFDPFDIVFAKANFNAYRENIWQKYQIQYQKTPQNLTVFFHGPYLDLTFETKDIKLFSEKLDEFLNIQNDLFSKNKWLLVHPFKSLSIADVSEKNEKMIDLAVKETEETDFKNPLPIAKEKLLREFDIDLNVPEFFSKEKSFYLKSKIKGYFIKKDLSFCFDHLRFKKGFLEIYPDKQLASIQKPLFVLKIAPDQHFQTSIKVSAHNLSALLLFFDIAKQTSDGHLELTATQDDSGIYRGDFTIREIQARVPLLGKLLSLISPMMLFELSSSKLAFQKVTGQFRYGHEKLEFKNAVVKGVNLGLTFSGNCDFSTQQLNLFGSLIPFYFLNTFFRNVPFLAWLFGGDQGLFSVEFKIKGNAENPEITFQPISILKMGFLRSIFEDKHSE